MQARAKVLPAFPGRAGAILLPGLVLASAAAPAWPAERVFENSRLYFTRTGIALLPGDIKPALARLTCAEGFRVGGYQLVPPETPIAAYPDNWAPISVTRVNYAGLNDWVLELHNKAEPPRPAFPLTIAFVCVDTSKG
jgi:hypothetical protein